MHVFHQTQQSGVKKIVVTSSLVTYSCLWHLFFFFLSDWMTNFLYTAVTYMLAFQGLTFKETGAYYCSIFLFYDLKTSIDWENAVDEESEENKEDKYLIYFTAKIKSELTLWEFVKEHPKLMMSLPVSFPNQNLMDPDLLKHTSSSSAGLYHRPMCRDLPPRHIHSHHGHERLHPPAHRPRRRTLRSGLDRRRARWTSSCSGCFFSEPPLRMGDSLPMAPRTLGRRPRRT